MTMLTIRVPGIPVPQGSMRALGPGRLIHNNNDRLKPWRQAITNAAMQAVRGDDTWTRLGPMRVDAVFTLPRPKAHYRANGDLKPAAPNLHDKRGDLDKFIRAALDALTDAGIWVDDAQVCAITATKKYGTHPGAEFTITPEGTE